MVRPRKPPKPNARASRKYGQTRRATNMGAVPLYDPKTYPGIAEKLIAELNYTDLQIADALSVNPSTIWRWKQLFPKFAKAFQRGEEKQKATIEGSMFQRATGYTVETEELFLHKGKVIRAKNTKHYPPDKGAAELLLKKLDPKVYNPRMIFEGDPSKPVQFIMLNRLPEEPAT